MKAAIEFLKSQIPDPRQGLPEDIFSFITQLTPMVNVDLLLRDDDGRFLLSWRSDLGPGCWHIPGGIVRLQESLESRLHKTAAAELQCTAEFEPVPLDVHQFIFPELETRSHFISFLFRGKLTSEIPENLIFSSGTPADGMCRWFESVPENFISYQKYYSKFLNSFKENYHE